MGNMAFIATIVLFAIALLVLIIVNKKKADDECNDCCSKNDFCCDCHCSEEDDGHTLVIENPVSKPDISDEIHEKEFEFFFCEDPIKNKIEAEYKKKTIEEVRQECKDLGVKVNAKTPKYVMVTQLINRTYLLSLTRNQLIWICKMSAITGVSALNKHEIVKAIMRSENYELKQ